MKRAAEPISIPQAYRLPRREDTTTEANPATPQPRAGAQFTGKSMWEWMDGVGGNPEDRWLAMVSDVALTFRESLDVVESFLDPG